MAKTVRQFARRASTRRAQHSGAGPLESRSSQTGSSGTRALRRRSLRASGWEFGKALEWLDRGRARDQRTEQTAERFRRYLVVDPRDREGGTPIPGATEGKLVVAYDTRELALHFAQNQAQSGNPVVVVDARLNQKLFPVDPAAPLLRKRK